jgi:hypothetical protein
VAPQVERSRGSARGWALALLGLALATGGCQRKTAAERERAAIEGRNLDGSSAASRDDRIPELGGEAIGPQLGCLADAFAYASAPARLLAWVLAQTSTPTAADAGLRAALGAHASARLRVSVAALSPAPSPAPSPAVGLHLRVHVDDPELGAKLLGWLRVGLDDGEQLCASLDRRLEWCARAAGRVEFARLTGEGLVFDLLWAAGIDGEDPATIEQSRAALDRLSGAAPAELAGLHGDAVAWVDASRLFAAGPAVARWLGADPAALDLLVAAPRLLDGVTLELALAHDRLLGRLRWRVVPGAEAEAAALFTLDPVDADVPSIPSLCADQQVCVRARGLPAAGRFAALATGLYTDPDTLADAIAAEPALAALSLGLTSWPHAIASLLRWPSRARDPGEGLVRTTLAELAGRVLGFGYARGDAGTVAYARVSGPDLARVRDYLGLVGASFARVEIPTIEDRVEAATTPSSGLGLGRWGLPQRSYVHFDPGEVWGWLVLADDDRQLAWLAQRERDDGAVPIVYVELAALAELAEFAGVPKLHGAGLRAQLSATPARVPELRFAIGALQ